MELDSDFESTLREQVMAGATERLDDENGVVAEAIERSEEQLEAVAARNDYDVEPVLDTLEGPTVEQRQGEIVVTWGWTHEAANFFERGTVDHWVEGNPVLAFNYPVSAGGPGGMVFSQGHEVTGIVESRFAREGLEWLESELRSEGL